MRKICSGALLMAAITVLSGLGAGTAMAYGPGDSRYYNDYYRGGPGVNYDYGTGYSGVYDYGGPSGTQPMFRTPQPMSSTQITGGTGMMMTMIGMMMTGGITAADQAPSTDRAGDTVPTAGGSSSTAAAGCPMAGS